MIRRTPRSTRIDTLFPDTTLCRSKMRYRIKRHGIQLRSSNYELYADLNRRFNAVIADHSDMVEIYSIDESFFRLPVVPDGLGNVVAAHAVDRKRTRLNSSH